MILPLPGTAMQASIGHSAAPDLVDRELPGSGSSTPAAGHSVHRTPYPDVVSASREDELAAFRSAAHALVDGVADHLAALPSRPVWQPLPDALREQLLDLPLPEHPVALDDLVATALRDVLPHAMGNGHPAFFGWVNPPPSPAGVMASLAAAAMNPSVVSGDHADVHLERAVVRWLAELVGFPHAPGAGLLTSGGSAATIVCLAGARSRALAAAGHDVRRDGLAGAPQLIAYVPAEAHSCVRRALELLGLGSGAMREVPLEGGRLDATALRASIAADRASGALPALLVGSAGTVNTGAIDPLDALADVAAAEDLWFHVDGAYGAFGVLDPAIAARYRGMERADSLVLDPHKWLGVPVDAGCALVRRGDDLRDAFSLIPPYLRQDTDAPVGTFAEYGPEQTRPFRALKTWATIAARGRAGIAAQVARANALARELATLVEREPELELAAAPETSIVAFRARPAGCPPARLDELNRALPEAVQARGRAFVTGTVFERPRDAARVHPAPRHDLGAPRDPRRRSRRDRRRSSPAPDHRRPRADRGPSGGHRLALRQRREPHRLQRLRERRDDLALAEEAHDLQRLVAGVRDAVGDHRRDDGEVAGLHRAALVAEPGLALAGDDVEDLLGAVGVACRRLPDLALARARRRRHPRRLVELASAMVHRAGRRERAPKRLTVSASGQPCGPTQGSQRLTPT